MKKGNLLKFMMLFLLLGGAINASAGTKTGTIKFGKSGTIINAASVTGEDDLGNTWTITTEGTTSFTPNADYYQVGASKKPASSITFTTTLPASVTITEFSAKFGGFNNTAGDISLKVGNTEVAAGKLDATTDVTVSSEKSASGSVLTVTVTNIDKGVKCYYISYSYDDANSKTTSKISFPEKSYNATMGEEFTAPELTVTAGNGEITYTSSNEEVATVGIDPTGAPSVTIVGVGTTTITATIAATDEYESSTASYTLTVEKPQLMATYYKVKNVSQLVDENQYILVYENADKAAAMGELTFYGSNEVGTSVNVTISGDEAEVDENSVNVLTLGITDNGYTFLANNQKYLSWATGNTLTTEESVSDASTWKIDNFFNITNVGTPERKLQYNVGSPRFACYASSQASIAIYAKVKPEDKGLSVTVGTENFATFTAPYDLDFSNATIKAYTATVSGDQITLTKKDQVAAGEGVLLYAKGGATEEIPAAVATTAAIEKTEGNCLIGVLKDIASLDSENEKYNETNYILNVGSKGIGFYAANGQKVAAGKAYLRVKNNTAGAKQFLSIDMDAATTGISELNAEKADNAIYNLNGVRVKEMNQKGVYIVNGKKVVKK